MNATQRGTRWTLKLGLGGLFVATGALKLVDQAAFAQDIANYQLFPALAPWLAAALPGMEIVVGLTLALAPLRSAWLRPAALAFTFIMFAFTMAVAQTVARGIDVSCGCFGKSTDAQVSGLTIVRNLALLTLGAVATAWLRPSRERRCQAP